MELPLHGKVHEREIRSRRDLRKGVGREGPRNMKHCMPIV